MRNEWISHSPLYIRRICERWSQYNFDVGACVRRRSDQPIWYCSSNMPVMNEEMARAKYR